LGIAQGTELVLFGNQLGDGLLGAIGEAVELNMVARESGAAGQECQYRNSRKKSDFAQGLISPRPTI